MQMKENLHSSCPDWLEEIECFFQIDVTILDGFCHCCDLCFLQFQYTKVCPSGNEFALQVPRLLPCTGSEVAQGMQDVAAHLEAHDLHAGRLAKVSVAELEYGMQSVWRAALEY